jgi:hypothetical protein
VAGRASQIEAFKMSTREIEAKFTKSEIVFLSWSSRETSFNLEKRFKPLPESTGGERETRNYGGVEVPRDLPERFYDPKTGEIDLSRVTGSDAYKYFQKIGIRLPIFPVDGPRKDAKETKS